MLKNEIRTLSNTIHRNKLKMDSRPKCKTDTIELLEENIGRALFDINHSKIFYDPLPRVMEIKTKINKWDLMKLQSFCTAKETINNTLKGSYTMIKWDLSQECKDSSIYANQSM